MLAVTAESLQAISLALLLLGAAVLLAFGVQLIRSGAWRNPLSGCKPPPPSGAWAAVIAALLTYVVVVNLAAGLLLPDTPPPTTQSAPNLAKPVDPPGSHVFHLMQSFDAAGKLAGAGVMCAFILWPMRRRGDAAASRRSLRSLAAITLLAALATTSLTLLELFAAETIWRWLQPGAKQPVHQVLVALKYSVWNGPGEIPWGTVQLCIGAVVVAPLSEELFFRGVLLRAFHESLRHAWLAVLFSAIVFGAIHGAQPQDVLPLTVMGVALAFVRLRYGSLWVCIGIHALFNARTMALAVLSPELIGG